MSGIMPDLILDLVSRREGGLLILPGTANKTALTVVSPCR